MKSLTLADVVKAIKSLNAALKRKEVVKNASSKAKIQSVIKRLVEIRDILRNEEREERLVTDLTLAMSSIDIYNCETVKISEKKSKSSSSNLPASKKLDSNLMKVI